MANHCWFEHSLTTDRLVLRCDRCGAIEAMPRYPPHCLLSLVQCDGPRLVGANPPRLAPVVPSALWKGAPEGPFLVAAHPLQQPLFFEG
jgi:hypothetical protein